MELRNPLEIFPRLRKTVCLSIRQRMVLHRLLHRDVRKCSGNALASFQRHGYSLGAAGGFQLTAKGRAVAEMSERAPANGPLDIDFDPTAVAVS